MSASPHLLKLGYKKALDRSYRKTNVSIHCGNKTYPVSDLIPSGPAEGIVFHVTKEGHQEPHDLRTRSRGHSGRPGKVEVRVGPVDVKIGQHQNR